MDFVIKRGQACYVQVDDRESESVKIAVSNLKADLEKVLEVRTVICEEVAEHECGMMQKATQIHVGTIGVSGVIEDMVDVNVLQDENGILRKEAYLLYIRDGQLIIVGTDRRGTIYGIYEFCEYIGVSPWYFWADVPVKKRQEISLPADYIKIDYPSIEYRGIFINDEEELEVWVRNYMGEETIGVKTYEKLFELLLRLKGNYIWPAMHVNSFNVVQENGALAERMGIVVGTSHCDMLMRSNLREWEPWLRKKGYTDVAYDYSIQGRNREILQEYWRESVEQNQDFEVCYTLGMRGIHDSNFETRDLKGSTEEEIKQAKMELLTTIIHDQQEILNDTLGHETMQTFIPYKEVLPLYDAGLEVPENVTLVWANDNYGYIRRYPSETEKKRRGGNGIYYHNSYWSPPSMSYVFLPSIPLAHTGNELRKAYEEEIRKLWILNVGAMKPLEQEMTFFLRLAWEIGKENALTEDVDAYVADWINRTFSGNIGAEVALLLNDFSQLTNVRKLENMSSDVFSQTAYGDEAAVRIHKYEELFEKGNALYANLPEEERDAFFQMVLMRIHAAYFTNLQFYYGDRSTLMHSKGKMQAAAFYTKKSFEFDNARRKMLVYYNKIMAEGKWDGILDPEGYPPPRTAMMPICTPPLQISGETRMIVDVWNEDEELCFVRPAEKWIELGNGGPGEFAYEISAPEWITLSKAEGTVCTEERIMVGVEAVSENREGNIIVRNLTDGTRVEIPVRVAVPGDKAILSDAVALDGEIAVVGCNIEEDGKVVVEAESVSCEGTGFRRIKRAGRGCGSLVEACVDESFGANAIQYQIYITNAADATLEIHRFPSLNSVGRIRIGVSIDGGSIQIVETPSTDEWRGNWRENVRDNVDRLYLQLPELEAGLHTIAFYPVDKYFAFSRFVIYTKERKHNNFIGIAGNQQLPELWDVDKWTTEFYGKFDVGPRPVYYAQIEKEVDNVVASDLMIKEECFAEPVEPDWYLQEGSSAFIEKDGSVCIDAASALAQSDYAYTARYEWQYCSCESYGRSGLAMYIRQPDLSWTQENAPVLNYRMQCSGGEYTIWLLTKVNTEKEAYFDVCVDGKPLERKEIYMNGNVWRFQSDQAYRWVPIAWPKITAGEHELQICSLASGMRFDRIYVTKGSELPPMDSEWKGLMRI